MMDNNSTKIPDNNGIPQWKLELIARRQNKQRAQCPPAAGQQPFSFSSSSSCSSTSPPAPAAASSSSAAVAVASGEHQHHVLCCDRNPSSASSVTSSVNMVQDRPWGEDSDEDLRYGPGIVSRLKNRYLSLALRQSAPRASILPMRKAASLENILDNDDEGSHHQVNHFMRNKRGQYRQDNKYKGTALVGYLKRARSVETISTVTDSPPEPTRPKSMHEDLIIQTASPTTAEGCDIIDNNGHDNHNNKCEEKPPVPPSLVPSAYRAVNRPKRIQPVMKETEKPPADLVKQTKLIFERRNSNTTTTTTNNHGEVAAKVANFTNIIQAKKKSAKKPQILTEKPKLNGSKVPPLKSHHKRDTGGHKIVISPIPDVSMTDSVQTNGKQLSQTPDLIITSSPLDSPAFRKTISEKFIREEIDSYEPHSLLNTYLNNHKFKPSDDDEESKDPPDDESGVKRISPQSITNINKASNTVTYNFASSPPPTNKNVLNTTTPTTQPLKLEINGHHVEKTKTPSKKSSPVIAMTMLEMEKNIINSVKTMQHPVVVHPTSPPPPLPPRNEEVKTVPTVPKVKRPSPRHQQLENNSVVFKFTDRKDVPDYVHNDGTTRVSKVERPKVGEGGIILLPGASIGESFTDDDDEFEILRSLEAPPSPCDVSFINDNVLIDGKSSLSQKSKKLKMRISFVDAGPEIFEYPSESSLMMVDETSVASPSSNGAHMGHTVPSLAGNSSLANYTPKSSTSEDFQPGITRSSVQTANHSSCKEEKENIDDLLLKEAETPTLFSAGTNSDILF